MPNAWSEKDERQFEHVKESELERGVPEDQAAQIAGRTVNKQRRKEGRTPNKRTQGTGNSNRPLEARTRDELYNLAIERGVAGRARLKKAELVAALKQAR